MARFSDIVSANSKRHLDKLLEQIDKQKFKRNEDYNERHIFKSYEEALDYVIVNYPVTIQWHEKQICWSKEQNKFKSYEQEYDIDGVLAFDVVKYYTREQLLNNIKRHMENVSKKYSNDNRKWWLDENNMLSYVYLLT